MTKFGKISFFAILFAAVAVIAVAALPAEAALVPDECRLQNIKNGTCTLCHLAVLTKNITDFLMFSIAFPSAVLIILVGGVAIMTAGPSPTRLQKGKDILTRAIIGLIIVMVAWLAVDTAIKILTAQSGHPGTFLEKWGPWNRIKTECGLTPGTVSAEPSAYAPPRTYAPTAVTPALSSETRLLEAGIQVSSSGNCSDPSNPNCTSTAGLPDTATDGLIKIKRECGDIRVTGGTEIGHRSHGPGQPVVDLAYSPRIANCIKQNAGQFKVKQICTRPQDAAYRIDCSFAETAPHLHVVFES